MPSKQYFIQLARTINLVGATTTGLITIQPLLAGNPNWLQVGGTFALAVLFMVGHSTVAHISDISLRNATNDTLDAVERLLPMTTTREQQAIQLPKSDKP